MLSATLEISPPRVHNSHRMCLKHQTSMQAIEVLV
jgi:hypothetical protein